MKPAPSYYLLVHLLAWTIAGATLLSTSDALADGMSVKQILRFASDMAKAGNWREAQYRWSQAEEKQPENPRVLNNLAVAFEALGDSDQAERYYRRALELSGGEARITDNLRRHSVFADQRPSESGVVEDEFDATAIPVPSGSSKKAGKGHRVAISLPVPPKIEVEDGTTVLVASFLTVENSLLDTSRELVKFLRNEFRKRTRLEVLEVIPPPAVPEQSIEDLLANAEFWKHLGREYGADLIVSGVVRYDRSDVSGFREVDVVSPATGQKVRTTQFVDQEEFSYALDVFFMDGLSGNLRFRDRMRRSLLFRGAQNDPITAFYEMSDSIASDVLAVVIPRTRNDVRFVFKN